MNRCVKEIGHRRERPVTYFVWPCQICYELLWNREVRALYSPSEIFCMALSTFCIFCWNCNGFVSKGALLYSSSQIFCMAQSNICMNYRGIASKGALLYLDPSRLITDLITVVVAHDSRIRQFVTECVRRNMTAC